MEWGERLVELLERSFQLEHMTSATGKSYGAGEPLSALSLLQSVIPVEELEYYPELLVDEWAAQQLIDNELGLETLIEFDMGGSSEHSGIVQFILLEGESVASRLFLGRKVDGSPLEFLAAIDAAARASLLPALLLTMLAADAAFGESTHEVRLPSSITNYRPDLFEPALLERGIGLMLDHLEGLGVDAWGVLAARIGATPSGDRSDIINDYFYSVYTESESW